MSFLLSSESHTVGTDGRGVCVRGTPQSRIVSTPIPLIVRWVVCRRTGSEYTGFQSIYFDTSSSLLPLHN